MLCQCQSCSCSRCGETRNFIVLVDKDEMRVLKVYESEPETVVINAAIYKKLSEISEDLMSRYCLIWGKRYDVAMVRASTFEQLKSMQPFLKLEGWDSAERHRVAVCT